VAGRFANAPGPFANGPSTVSRRIDSVNVRSSAVVAAIVVVMIGTAFWYYRSGPGRVDTAELGDTGWLELLHSQNPSVAEDATAELEELGTSALPQIEKALTEPAADVARRKAALKASALLGEKA